MFIMTSIQSQLTMDSQEMLKMVTSLPDEVIIFNTKNKLKKIIINGT